MKEKNHATVQLSKVKKIRERYDEMTILCKKAISQCEEIVFSDKKFKISKELYGYG